ncbi:hypothetical protein BH23PLA1_BH23PLA1_12290 [soil metagenome]
MAIDPNAPTQTSQGDTPFENEIPEYRAISGGAVFSLLLGLIAILSFVNPYFLLAAFAAVLFGALALRKIRRNAKILTGAGLANVGIALGLIFGLAAGTFTAVQTVLIGQQATGFAEEFARSIEAKDFAGAVSLQVPPSMRQGKTSAQVIEDMQQQSIEDFESDPRVTTIRQILDRLDHPEQYLHVLGIETKGFDGLTPFAYVVLYLHGPPVNERPANEYVMIEVRGEKQSGSNQWWVQTVTYPYEVGSAAMEVRAAHTHADGSSH